jgi:sodium transport system permease protein
MLRNIRLLFHKEILGAVRDRRTVLLTVIFPLVFYPLVLAVMGRFTAAEAPRFDLVAGVIAYVDDAADPWLRVAVVAAEGVRGVPSSDPARALATVDRGEAQIAAIAGRGADGERVLTLHLNPSDPLAALASERLRAGILIAREEAVRVEIAELGGDYEAVAPAVVVSTTQRAPGESAGRLILSRLLPYFLVLAILTGAMNLGAEITAGEKERGTIATLLVSQLSRTEIVVGKFAAVLSVSLVSSILSAIGLMIGLRFFGRGLVSASATGSASGMGLGAAQLGGVLIILVPLAIVIAALVIIVGSYARSQKEASTYLIPIYMAIVLVGLASMTGGATLAGSRFLIPVANAMFALQEVILGTAETAHLLYTLAANLALGAVLVAASIRLFRREAVLFRS